MVAIELGIGRRRLSQAPGLPVPNLWEQGGGCVWLRLASRCRRRRRRVRAALHRCHQVRLHQGHRGHAPEEECRLRITPRLPSKSFKLLLMSHSVDLLSLSPSLRLRAAAEGVGVDSKSLEWLPAPVVCGAPQPWTSRTSPSPATRLLQLGAMPCWLQFEASASFLICCVAALSVTPSSEE